MKNWLEYAKSLERDGTETESEIFDHAFVELVLSSGTKAWKQLRLCSITEKNLSLIILSFAAPLSF